MNLSQLEYIIEVAKVENITIASQNLFVSQAAISQSITALEEELGVKIFKRSRKGAMLTEEGNIIVKKAEEIMGMVQELAYDSIDEPPTSQEVRLALTPGCMSIIQNNLNAFKASFPDVNINMIEKESAYIIEDIQQDKADIGIIGMHKNTKISNSLVFESLLESKIKIFVNPTSSIITPKMTITPQQLLVQKLVLYNSPTFINIINQLRKKYRYSQRIFISNHFDMIKRMIIDEYSVSMFTEFYAKYDPQVLNGDILPLTLLNYDQNMIVYGCIYSKHKALSTSAQEILQYIKKQIKAHF